MKENVNQKKIESTRAETQDWNSVKSNLFPDDASESLLDTDLEDAIMLTDSLVNSNNCYAEFGDVVARYCEDFELVFRINGTLQQRLLDERFGSLRRGRRIALDIRHCSPAFRDSTSPLACVWAEGGGQYESVIRDCIGFVQWAETGFVGFPASATSRVLSRIRLELDLLEYSMLTHFREIVDNVRIQTFHMSWDAVFEIYESEIACLDESDFECIARRTFLGWLLFPDKRPFSSEMDDLGSDEIVGMLIEESTNGDRRYQNGRHDNHG